MINNKLVNDAMQALTVTMETIADVENARKETENAFYDFINAIKAENGGLFKKRTDEQKATAETFHNEIARYDDILYRLQIERAVNLSNLRYCLFNDVVQAISHIQNKYAGKPYGDKTRKKINDELNAVIPATIHITQRDIKVCFNSVYAYKNIDFTISLKNEYTENARFLVDNKIQAYNADKFIMAYARNVYYVDVKQAVNDIITSRENVARLNAEYSTAVNAYNNLKTDFLPDVAHVNGVSKNALHSN